MGYRIGPPINMDGSAPMFTLMLVDPDVPLQYRSWWTKCRVIRWQTHHDMLMFNYGGKEWEPEGLSVNLDFE